MPLRITWASSEAVSSESQVASRPSGSLTVTPNWWTPTRARSASVPRSRSASTTRRALFSSMLLESTHTAHLSGGRATRPGRTGSALVQPAQVTGHVHGVPLQHGEWDQREHGGVRRGEHDRRGRPLAVGARPVGGRDAPAVARVQAGELVLRHRRREVVADASLVVEELGGDHRADGVAAQVLRAGAAAPVAVEARDRVGPAGLELLPQDVELGLLTHDRASLTPASRRSAGPRRPSAGSTAAWSRRSPPTGPPAPSRSPRRRRCASPRPARPG